MVKFNPKKKASQPQSTFPYIVVGIDPGKAGGVSWITPSKVITATPMPDGEEELNDLVATLEEVQSDEMLALGDGLFLPQNSVEIFVFIEKVHSMPQQSSVATFTFGVGFGMVRQAFSVFPREFVPPQTWMKGLQIPNRAKTESKPQYKKRLCVKARQLFPKLGCWAWGKGKQMSVADSLLIMEYGRRKLLSGGIK